jgi:uncharacterized protein (TIGR02996 family)
MTPYREYSEEEFVNALRADPLQAVHHATYTDWLREQGRDRDADYREQVWNWLQNRRGVWRPPTYTTQRFPGQMSFALDTLPNEYPPELLGLIGNPSGWPPPVGFERPLMLRPTNIASGQRWVTTPGAGLLNDPPVPTGDIHDLFGITPPPGEEQNHILHAQTFGGRWLDNLNPAEQWWAGITDPNQSANLPEPNQWDEVERLLRQKWRHHGGQLNPPTQSADPAEPIPYGDVEDLTGRVKDSPWDVALQGALFDALAERHGEQDPRARFQRQVYDWLPERFDTAAVTDRDEDGHILGPYGPDVPFVRPMVYPLYDSLHSINHCYPWAISSYRPGEAGNTHHPWWALSEHVDHRYPGPDVIEQLLGAGVRSAAEAKNLRTTFPEWFDDEPFQPLNPAERAYLEGEINPDTDPAIWPQLEHVLRGRFQLGQRFASPTSPTNYGLRHRFPYPRAQDDRVRFGSFPGCPGDRECPPLPLEGHQNDWNTIERHLRDQWGRGEMFSLPGDGPINYGEAEDTAAFLHAIRADPSDLTTHGVYADWLDEVGRLSEAEFRRGVRRWVLDKLEHGPNPLDPYDSAGEVAARPGFPIPQITHFEPSGWERTPGRGIPTIPAGEGAYGTWDRANTKHGAPWWGAVAGESGNHDYYTDFDALAMGLGYWPTTPSWNWDREMIGRIGARRPGPPLTEAERIYAGIDIPTGEHGGLWHEVEDLLRHQWNRGQRFASNRGPTNYGEAEDIAAFLQAIRANPNDYASRGAFADYLEEMFPHEVTRGTLDFMRRDQPSWVRRVTSPGIWDKPARWLAGAYQSPEELLSGPMGAREYVFPATIRDVAWPGPAGITEHGPGGVFWTGPALPHAPHGHLWGHRPSPFINPNQAEIWDWGGVLDEYVTPDSPVGSYWREFLRGRANDRAGYVGHNPYPGWTEPTVDTERYARHNLPTAYAGPHEPYHPLKNPGGYPVTEPGRSTLAFHRAWSRPHTTWPPQFATTAGYNPLNHHDVWNATGGNTNIWDVYNLIPTDLDEHGVSRWVPTGAGVQRWVPEWAASHLFEPLVEGAVAPYAGTTPDIDQFDLDLMGLSPLWPNELYRTGLVPEPPGAMNSIRDPDDWQSRLVFADWLDDNGVWLPFGDYRGRPMLDETGGYAMPTDEDMTPGRSWTRPASLPERDAAERIRTRLGGRVSLPVVPWTPPPPHDHNARGNSRRNQHLYGAAQYADDWIEDYDPTKPVPTPSKPGGSGTRPSALTPLGDWGTDDEIRPPDPDVLPWQKDWIGRFGEIGSGPGGLPTDWDFVPWEPDIRNWLFYNWKDYHASLPNSELDLDRPIGPWPMGAHSPAPRPNVRVSVPHLGNDEYRRRFLSEGLTPGTMREEAQRRSDRREHLWNNTLWGPKIPPRAPSAPRSGPGWEEVTPGSYARYNRSNPPGQKAEDLPYDWWGPTPYGVEDDYRRFRAAVHANPLEQTGHNALVDFLTEHEHPDLGFRQRVAEWLQRRRQGWVAPGFQVHEGHSFLNPQPGEPTYRLAAALNAGQDVHGNRFFTPTMLRPTYQGTNLLWQLSPSGNSGHWALNQADTLRTLGYDPDSPYAGADILHAGMMMPRFLEHLNTSERIWTGLDDPSGIDPENWQEIERLLLHQHRRGIPFGRGYGPTQYGDYENFLAAVHADPNNLTGHGALSDYLQDTGDSREPFRREVYDYLTRRRNTPWTEPTARPQNENYPQTLDPDFQSWVHGGPLEDFRPFTQNIRAHFGRSPRIAELAPALGFERAGFISHDYPDDVWRWDLAGMHESDPGWYPPSLRGWRDERVLGRWPGTGHGAGNFGYQSAFGGAASERDMMPSGRAHIMTEAEKWYAGITNPNEIDPRIWPQIEAILQDRYNTGLHI